ncbi:MAG: hypothetical protein R3B82_22265 [Sandaracinaceae bacterium]
MALREAVTEYLDHRESAALAAEARERLTQLEGAPRERGARRGGPGGGRAADRGGALRLRSGARELVRRRRDREARERLETILRQRAGGAAALERLAHDRNPGVGARARAVFLVGLGMLGIGTTAYALHQGAQHVTPSQLVVLPIILFVALAVGTLGLRRKLLTTTFGRQTSWMLWVVMGLLVIERLVGFVSPTTPEIHFTRDSLMVASAFLASALGYGWWLLAIGLLFLVAFFVGAVWPEHGRTAFTLAGSLSMFVGARAQLVIARGETASDAAKDPSRPR